MTTSIMIVDDEQEIRDSISEVLTEEGYLAYTAENGAVHVVYFRINFEVGIGLTLAYVMHYSEAI